jgi:1-acyl-sn-glycerol-3-phosphate acyltransferase
MSGLFGPDYPGATAVALLRRRLQGTYDIDEWGLDPELVAFGEPFVGLRWDIEVLGAERLPATGGAVLVFNRRLGFSEPWVLARGIRRASGRFVRTVGVPDLAPIGPLLRRFGGVADRPDEIASLLRAGQLVGLPMARHLRDRDHVGDLQVDRIAAALATGAPVVPVALVGREAGRRWRVVVGDPVTTRRRGGPLAAAEQVEATETAVQALLDDAVPAGWWY